MENNTSGHDVSANSAIEFLLLFYPQGPWLLTAIQTDRKAIETRTFGPDSADRAASWIEEFNGIRNIYFSVNPPLRELKKKAERADIKELAWLHVDLDPRAGENIDAERERILKVLESPPGELPPPTCIIFSGGGYQAFWRLSDPMPINGEEEAYEEAKRYNMQIESLLDADNCHNVDRIMRLPGTVNVPDAIKTGKGRKPVLSMLHFFDEGRVYPLSDFTQAPKETPTADVTVAVSGDVKRLGNVDELDDWNVSDRVKAIIVSGPDPDNPKDGDDSRSAWLFDALCHMARCSVPDDVMYAAITDPAFGISESVLEKGGKMHSYAIKQIRSAKEAVANEPAVLHKETPVDSAKKFVAKKHPTLMHLNGDWLSYAGADYRELEDATVRSEVYAFLNKSLQLNGDEPPKPFNPNKAKVGNVMDALLGVAHRQRDVFVPPCWIDGAGLPAKQIVACQNGLLHLPTGELLRPTQNFFTRNALSFDYDASAARPDRWIEFLRSLWPGEDDEIDTLQEVFGYVLIPDTSQQKIFMLVGPTRSGKGTIARVLTNLVGLNNTCAPTLASLSDGFGLQPLIGKQLAIVSDVRLGRKTDHAAIAENLLRISGEDMITTDRKYKSPWHGRLSARFLLMTNVMPRFADASGAVANRFVPLIMHQSFLDRENPGLIDELLPELPGILNWATEGWRRLNDRGYFDLPGSSREVIRHLADLASPEGAFMRDECELLAGAIVAKAEIYKRWKSWCESQGDMHAGTTSKFGTNLIAAANGKVRPTKPRGDGGRVPSYKGIRLLDAPDDPNREMPF